jgi:hypothetical protein
MSPRAFTLSANGLLETIISPVSICQGQHMTEFFGAGKKQVDVKALWDTGSSTSSISKRLAKHLAFISIEVCEVAGIHGIDISNVYIADILLPNSVVMHNIYVTEFFDNDAFDVIIGMDIITQGDFAISNETNNTTVSFRIPPGHPAIDFMQQR